MANESSKRVNKIVFVSGDFNVLHPGHLRLLKFAKESGDYLVVGVNSDFISKNKGFEQYARLESIKATSYVDEAFILDEAPELYIGKTKPHIVVKGREYKYRENNELKILDGYGGKLIFTSGEIGFSSLDLLEKEFDFYNHSNIQHSDIYLNRHNINFSDLRKAIHDFSKLQVLVIGDAIVDEYITCDPLGMSQEDPTIVVSPISKNKFIGGAAIVASHAKSLGADVSLITVSGEDAGSEYLKNKLRDLGVNIKCYVDETRPTTLKQRFRANGKTLLRVSHLKQHKIEKNIELQIISKVEALASCLDLVVFSDFSYGLLTNSLISSIEEIAVKHKIPMVADSQSSSQTGDISKFCNMQLVTPTEREIRLALNDFESGLVVLSKKLHKKSGAKYILTTLGSEGVMIYNSNKGELLTDNIPALNLSPKDVSGAGDSLLTCASMALALNRNIWQSVYLGSMAAAIQVGRVGNIPITKDELLAELE